jgi:hypothetical protein
VLERREAYGSSVYAAVVKKCQQQISRESSSREREQQEARRRAPWVHDHLNNKKNYKNIIKSL